MGSELKRPTPTWTQLPLPFLVQTDEEKEALDQLDETLHPPTRQCASGLDQPTE